MIFCKYFATFAHLVPPSDLVEKVIEADNNEDDDRIDGILCGALRKLKNNRAKPDPAVYFSLMYVAKVKPLLFELEDVMQVMGISGLYLYMVVKK